MTTTQEVGGAVGVGLAVGREGGGGHRDGDQEAEYRQGDWKEPAAAEEGPDAGEDANGVREKEEQRGRDNGGARANGYNGRGAAADAG